MSETEIPQKINDKPEHIYLNRHVRNKLCEACDVNPLAWKDLGTELMPDAVTELSTISAQHHGSVVDCCSSLFQLWLQKQPNASWRQLIEALKKISLNCLATEIEKNLIQSVHPASQSIVPLRPIEVYGQSIASFVADDESINISNLFKEPITIRNAYVILCRKLDNILQHSDLDALKKSLFRQADTPDGVELEISLRRKIKAAKSVPLLLDVLEKSDSYTWLDTRLIEVLAYGSQSSSAVEIIKAYQRFLFPKKLLDVLPKKSKGVTIEKYIAEVHTKTKMDPSAITVEEFIDYRWTIETVILDLAKGLLNIEHINKGCLEIGYFIPVQYSFDAYKMVLHNHQKFYTIGLIHIEIGDHPVIYDPWLSDLETHSVKQSLHARQEMYHILWDNLPVDDIIKLFTDQKLFTDDDLDVISFTPSEYLKSQFLFRYLKHLKLAVWSVVCDVLHNTKSLQHIGSQLMNVLKENLEHQRQTLTSSTGPNCVNTTHGARTIKLHFVDDSTLFNKPQASHVRKLSLHVCPFQNIKHMKPSDVEKEFHYISEHIVELLSHCNSELLIKWCENLLASKKRNIKLLPLYTVYKLRKLRTSSAILKMMSMFWSWSNHSILTCLVEFSEIAAALLEEFDSRLYFNSSITKYPISSSLAPAMIPHNNNSFTVLTLKCIRKLQITLQLVCDIQSMMIEKFEITEHALQLLAVQSSPLVLQWMIPKYIVTIINVNVRRHQEYFATKGITEIFIHHNIKHCIDSDPELRPVDEASKADAMINQFLAAEISEFPKDILIKYVNDVTVDDVEKKTKCNKLLRKAVQLGDIDLVELILTKAANQVDVNNPVNENDVTTEDKNPKLSVNPAYIGWTPLHFAANILTNISYLSNNSTQYQEVSTNARLAAHLQLQVRALDIIMLLWRANANPLKPANWQNVLPVNVTYNQNVIALLLRILMELKDNRLIADVLDDLDDDYKTLMEWACKCAHVEIATYILKRLNDPNAELLQVTKGSIILRILGRSEKLEHFVILDALFKKYNGTMQEHIFDRNHAYANPKTHGSTPLSIAYQFDEDTKLCNNERFIKWSLRCFSNSLTKINLHNTGLTGKLSLSLFEFVNLKVINVSTNNLTGLTEAGDHPAFACNELEEAIFYDNKFTLVPKNFFLLPKLKNLNFANNKITNLILDGIELYHVSINNINLSCNEIAVIPDQLFYLPNLMHLNLDNNEIAELPVQMWFSPCLVHLSINNNSLVELPVPTEVIEEFHAERSISSLGTNDTGYCSYSFRETMMKPYETIEFEESDIDMVQGGASYGLRLGKLQLDGNKLQQIPADLACLAPYLSELSVANNELAITPCLRSLPVLLKRLNLSSNKLTTFLTPIFTSLYPSENCLRKKLCGSSDTCTHCAHKTLIKLEKLDMSYNFIDDDVYTKYNDIVYFEKLIDLNLSNNKFKTFPDFILHLPLLAILDVSNNYNIEKIPRSLAKLPLISFEYLGIADPVVKTLECIPYDVSSKLRCLHMLTEKAVKTNSIKMMLVGMHQKGKTTLLRRLSSKGDFEDTSSHQPPKDPVTKTVGIKLGLWKYSKNRGNSTNKHPIIEFYAWDFAGDEYYCTHQLFLQSRTIYLVVWNVLDKEDGIYSLSPWLQGIYARAPQSAVIIVGTHFDLIEPSQRKQFAERYHKLIEQSFTNHHDRRFWPLIKSIYFVGLVPKTYALFTHDMYVDELRDHIYDTALNMESPIDEFAIAMKAPRNIRIVDELVPENFKKFQGTIRCKKEIFKLGNVFPILEYRHFEYFAEVTEIPKEEVTTLLLYLQSQGLIVHFNFREVSKYYFIDPEWLNQVFSSLLSQDNIIESITSEFISNGIILREHLEQHLFKVHHIQPKHVKDMVRLLEKFQVIVSIGLNSFLVPALLADDAAIVTVIKGSFPRPATITPLIVETTQPIIPPLQMLSTGVVMRRLYVLHGIQIGFWPKLIAHFYTEKTFFDIVNKAIKSVLQLDVDPGDNFTPKWHYSKHSIELVMNHTTILKIGSVGRDYMDMMQTSHCYSNEINLAKFHFYDVTGEFKISDFKLYSGVLIEVNDFVFVSSNPERVIYFTKDNCQHSAELLAFAVEMFDCLLSEVSYRARLQLYDDSNWLKELIPCPFCLGDKQLGGSEAECAGSDGQNNDPSSKNDDLPQEPYYFTINYCLIEIKHNRRLQCPKHGVLAMECLAPDLVFQDISHKIYSPTLFSKKLEREECGSFGKVFKDYQSNVAVKIIKPYSLADDEEYLSYTYKCVRQEIDKLLYLKPHPQIAQVLGVLCNPYGLVLELPPVGDLQSSIIDNYRYIDNLLCSTAILLTLKQISSALAYLHEHRIIHRDVKPNNILVFSYPDENHISISNPQNWNCETCVGKDGRGVLVKLSNFGASVRVTFTYYGNAGTAGYRAPEFAGLAAADYNEKVDVYSLAMTLYAMLTLRRIPLKGIPCFEQLIMAGRRPKFTTMDPVYPFILYECIRSCWHQEQSMRPSASTVLERLSKFPSSLLNKYTLKAPSSLSNVTIVSGNQMQRLWAVMEYHCRSYHDPDITKNVELISIHQHDVTRLEINKIDQLPLIANDATICIAQLGQWVMVGYEDMMAVYDAIGEIEVAPYKVINCLRCACSLKCLEVYPNNPTSLFAGQAFGRVHLLLIEDVEDSDNWVKYCYDLHGEELITMRACWYDTHVELWCSTALEYIEILQFPMDAADCNNAELANVVLLPLPTAGIVVSIECCMVHDELLIFTVSKHSTVVTCWNGLTKELLRNIHLSETLTCIRVIEPNLYIGTRSGDMVTVTLEDVMDTQLGFDHWVWPYTDTQRYCHRGPVLALVGVYGTMGCQGNLMRLFSRQVDVNQRFRQEVACSLVISIGYGYQSPWNRKEDDDDVGQSVDEQDNNLCLLVHLVC